MKDKIRLLFVINNLNVGGSEKALISLLNNLDYSKFEVDLQLFKHVGMFLNDLPAEVNLLPVPTNYWYFDSSFTNALKTLKPKIIFNRYKFTKIRKKAKSAAEGEQRAWKYLNRALVPLKKEYDVAIGYLEKNPIYFVVDKVNAKKKIGFIHNDYKNIKVDAKIDQPYFEILDNICSVSEHCVDILKECFPSCSEKIKLIPNLYSEKLIFRKSEEPLTEFEIKDNIFNILSIGRLAEQKGFDIAIDTALILKNKNFEFKWFVLGEGSLRSFLEKKIEELNLQNQFILLGNHLNPYKFIKKVDLIAQTSRFEGKSIAIDEAKLLNKIILVTNYPTANDQITNNINGYITDFEPENIAEKIMEIAENTPLNNRIHHYLQTNKQQNVNKLLELL